MERHGDLMVFEFDSGLSGQSSRARHNTLLSQYLSPPRCINGYRQNKCWELTATDKLPVLGWEEYKYSQALDTKENVDNRQFDRPLGKTP